MGDLRENEMTIVDSVDYVRGIQGSNGVLISHQDIASQVKDVQAFRIPPNEEYDTGISNYGLYQLDNYKNGGCALFIVSHNASFLISAIGSSFGTVEGEGSLALYKKESNGNIFIRNNTDVDLFGGFKRV